MIYDWGRQLAEHPEAIQWGFWYSDVEHYISKVTSGSRITLSYSVHGSRARIDRSPVDYTATPFGTALLILTSTCVVLASVLHKRGRKSGTYAHV